MRYIKNVQPVMIVDETSGIAQAEQVARFVDDEKTGKKEQKLFTIPLVYSGVRFVKELLTQNPLWKEDFSTLTAGLDIVKAYGKADADVAYIKVNDEVFDKLLEAVRNPKHVVITERGKELAKGYGWDNFVLFQLTSFIQAIFDATKEEPVFTSTASEE